MSTMALFYDIFEGMKRQGPGDEGTALRLLGGIPEGEVLTQVVDMGCGIGAGSFFLAEHTEATITAVDNYRPFLDRLDAEAAHQCYSERITSREASMFEPPFEPGSLDLVWSEGSAYCVFCLKVATDSTAKLPLILAECCHPFGFRQLFYDAG